MVVIAHMGPHDHERPGDGPDRTSSDLVRGAERLIMVIEDDADAAEKLAATLTERLQGTVEIVIATSLTEARTVASTRTLDCILSDVNLEESWGMETVDEVLHVAADVPVVVLSDEDDELLAIMAVQAGAQDFLITKHAGPEVIVRAINHSIERKRTELELASRALHDRLTGLPNRQLLHDRLEIALSRTLRDGALVGIIFIDLDAFKVVNDSLGHEAGDRLLCEVANRLEEATRSTDTVARYGGDEFVVLCTGLRNEAEAAGLTSELVEVLRQPVQINNGAFRPRASFGVAVGEARTATRESLLQQADEAMYQAKGSGIVIATATKPAVARPTPAAIPATPIDGSAPHLRAIDGGLSPQADAGARRAHPADA